MSAPFVTPATKLKQRWGCVLGASLLWSALSVAEPRDPTLTLRAPVGRPPGHAPMAQVDSARSGRSPIQLPLAPRVRWRARVPGSVGHGIVVDERGSVVVATSTHLCQLGREGDVQWSIRLGSATPASAPVLTNSGARWLVTTEGEVWCIRPDGRREWVRPLPVAVSGDLPEPLPTSGGGAVLAAGADAVWLEPDGRMRSQTTAVGRIAEIVGQGDLVYLVTTSGAVQRWRPPHDPTLVGSLGGPPSAVALAKGPLMLAVVDRRRLVELDLGRGVRRVRVPESATSLDAALVVTTRGDSWVATGDALLLHHDTRGREIRRVSLGGGAIASVPGAPPGGGIGRAGLLLDSEGTVAFARPDQELGVVKASGEIARVAEAACFEPAGLGPTGKRSLVLVCRSGLVWGIAD